MGEALVACLNDLGEEFPSDFFLGDHSSLGPTLAYSTSKPAGLEEPPTTSAGEIYSAPDLTLAPLTIAPSAGLPMV